MVCPHPHNKSVNSPVPSVPFSSASQDHKHLGVDRSERASPVAAAAVLLVRLDPGAPRPLERVCSGSGPVLAGVHLAESPPPVSLTMPAASVTDFSFCPARALVQSRPCRSVAAHVHLRGTFLLGMAAPVKPAWGRGEDRGKQGRLVVDGRSWVAVAPRGPGGQSSPRTNFPRVRPAESLCTAHRRWQGPREGATSPADRRRAGADARPRGLAGLPPGHHWPPPAPAAPRSLEACRVPHARHGTRTRPLARDWPLWAAARALVGLEAGPELRRPAYITSGGWAEAEVPEHFI